uniref:Uncharacterized protein n=1 Tax=Anguilla anguilla TaxID=7936 RepID=A0A0E9V769_ANGAN
MRCASAFFSVAVLTARIRNYQEHLQQHPKVRTEVKTTASLSFTLSPVQKNQLVLVLAL